jgi:hypothetical protein
MKSKIKNWKGFLQMAWGVEGSKLYLPPIVWK